MMTITSDLDYKTRPNNYELNHIPGTKGPPLIGNALPFIKDMLAGFQRSCGKVWQSLTYRDRGSNWIISGWCRQL